MAGETGKKYASDLLARSILSPPPDSKNPTGGCDRQPIVLLSSIDDQTPAWALGELYRRRRDIELDFRWLKVNAGWKHLLSHHANGVEIHFDMAMIGTLLLALFTERQPTSTT